MSITARIAGISAIAATAASCFYDWSVKPDGDGGGHDGAGGSGTPASGAGTGAVGGFAGSSGAGDCALASCSDCVECTATQCASVGDAALCTAYQQCERECPAEPCTCDRMYPWGAAFYTCVESFCSIACSGTSPIPCP
jgi:hypothetical protein